MPMVLTSLMRRPSKESGDGSVAKEVDSTCKLFSLQVGAAAGIRMAFHGGRMTHS